MGRSSRRGWILGVTVLALAAPPALAQFQKPISSRDTPPPGKRIEAHDGDTLVVRDGGRVRMIRRSEANVRALYDPVKRWIVVLVDYADPAGAPPDGKVDGDYRFEDVDGSWPFGERWEGSAVVDDYSMLQAGNSGIGLTADAGFVQLLGPTLGPWFRDDRAVSVVTYRSGGHSSMNGRLSFDEAERQSLAQLARESGPGGNGRSGSTSTFVLPNGGTATARVGMSIETTSPGGVVVASAPGGLADAPGPPSPPPQAPVRVGSQIKTPVKVVDVPAVLPATARQAGISGMVLVEITIGPDGAVRDAKVLRSIPLLDEAALAAVRQWRYEPTLLNGVPVAVITTAAVQVQ